MITEGKKNKAENYSSYFDPKTSGIVIKSHSSKVSSEKKNINQNIPSVSSDQKIPFESETIVNEPSSYMENFEEASLSSIPDQGYIKECIDALFEEDTINLVHTEDTKIFLTVTSVKPQLKIMLGTTDGLKKLKYYRKKYYKQSLKKDEIKEYYL